MITLSPNRNGSYPGAPKETCVSLPVPYIAQGYTGTTVAPGWGVVDLVVAGLGGHR